MYIGKPDCQSETKGGQDLSKHGAAWEKERDGDLPLVLLNVWFKYCIIV